MSNTMSHGLYVRDDEVNNGTSMIAIVGTFTGLSALFVAARLYVRIRLLRNLGLDDYLIVLAMVSLASLCHCADRSPY